jgi:hypothetical protein
MSLLHPPPDWTERAACAGQADAELDVWHPEPSWRKADREAATALAREVCATCPVRLPCARYGLALLADTGERGVRAVHGMYGGLTPAELRAAAAGQNRPTRKRAQHGTRAGYVGGCRCDDCRRANRTGERRRRVEHKSAAAG